jgi:hypothetical protein
VGVIMNKQKGFTLVEGQLIVLILSVVGFAGYYVWNQNQAKDTEISNYQQCVDAGNPIMESNPPICSVGMNSFIGSTIQPESESKDNLTANYTVNIDTYTTKKFGISFIPPGSSEVTERQANDAYLVNVEVNDGDNPSLGVYGEGNYKLQMLVYSGGNDSFLNDDQETEFNEAGYEVARLENTPSDGPPSTTYVISNGSVTISILSAGDVDEMIINPFIKSIRFN